MHVVVVESPAKAKTINKYLGSDYTVLASFGHVRDLPSKDGSVRPDDGFAMEYQTDPDSTKHISAIVKAVKSADTLYLATDPDREGEAISWHILNALEEKRALKDVAVQRITFNQITKNSVLEAMAAPRDLDMDLINAQQARRALDYLVGFTLSPILWRKLPGAKSAGRVQSVALRLVCEREAEIEAFVSREYWSVDADFTTESGESFTARLTHVDGQKLGKFSLETEADARKIVDLLSMAQFKVSAVDTREAKRNPSPPFTTSTLQQEAARKLGFNAKTTMQVAQKLYEGIDVGGETIGLITYMRTDGVYMAPEAVQEARQVIAAEYGASYVPDSPRAYKSKAKNAQEAHEAVRPTALTRRPADVAPYLNDAQLKLYKLIWRRAIASQMQSARLEKAAVDVAADEDRATLRATGSIILFDGFLRVYTEGRDDLQKAAPDAQDDNDDDRRLPAVAAGAPLNRTDSRANQHHTEPPPRFTEASLVKRMEELGIGRPSTYAAILSVLRDRSYVEMDKNRFIPSDVGRLVTTFLVHFFERYFDYDFTAQLEERLDDITEQRADWKHVLTDFWRTFSRTDTDDLPSVKDAVELIDKLIGKRGDVIDVIDQNLGPHFFPANDDKDPRACPSCGDGRLSIKFGRNGGFVGCSNYPECRYTRPLAVSGAEEDAGAELFPRLLGEDPETQREVSIRKGPYGIYTQLGGGETDDEAKPKRVSIPKNLDPLTIELETALKLLTLPRSVGAHPETGKDIKAGIGRFGPYLLHDSKYTSLKGDDDVLSIGLNRAVTVIAEAAERGGRRGATELRDMGAHPEDGAPVKIMDGRYGPYVAHNKINATLPKGTEPADLTMEQATELLKAKAAKGGKKKAAPKKTAAKKTTAKKATAKKTTAQKTSTQKKPAQKAAS